MRVWALASCSGLLALAACSAEQSTVPGPGERPQDGDSRAQVEADTADTPTTLNPTAAPELSPRPGLPSGLRPPTPAPLRAAADGRASPQSSDLQTRLQRLRAQHSARLSLGAGPVAAPSPLVRAPLTSSPLAIQPAASPLSVPPAPAAAPAPAPTRASILAARAPQAGMSQTGQSQTGQPQTGAPATGLTASGAGLTAALPPQLADPGVASDLGPLASLSPDQRYPIAPRRHQGYSARRSPTTLVLTSQPETALALAATPRLHGEGAEAPGVAAVPPTAANLSSETLVPENLVPETLTPETAAPGAEAAPTSATAAAVSPPAPPPGQHQGSRETPSLGVGRSPVLAGTLAQRPTATPQPESLPLHSPAPSLGRGRAQPLGFGAADRSGARPPSVVPATPAGGHRGAATAAPRPLLPGEQGNWLNLPEAPKQRLAPCPREATAPHRHETLATDPGRGEVAMPLGLAKEPELCAGEGPSPEATLPEATLPQAALRAWSEAPAIAAP